MWLPHRLLFAPFLAQLVVTRRCNLACGYCNEFDTTSPPVPAPLLRARIDHLKKLGTFSLELTGGEPLLHPRISELVAYARARGFYKVMMISNAYLLGAREVERLNHAGLMELQVSVDGVRPNGTTVKVLKPLLPKLETLARLARFRVVVSAVLGACPPHEALEVVKTARALGFRSRVLVLHDAGGQMQLDPAEQATLAQLRRQLGAELGEAHEYRERILKRGAAPFKCRAGSRYLYVDEHGDVTWCSQTRELFRKPLLDYRPADLRDQFYAGKPCSDSCTLGCVRTQSAYDEWRAQAAPVANRARRLRVYGQ
jgi:MoaA/NifB/PqqE/SkfB family radical SAM enzyme